MKWRKEKRSLVRWRILRVGGSVMATFYDRAGRMRGWLVASSRAEALDLIRQARVTP